MSVDKLNEKKFDEMLGRTLRWNSVPVPADFTERMLKQIREAEEQRILSRVVMQERFALAGCIVLGIITVVVATVFPSIAGSLAEQVEVFVAKISQAIESVSYQWQFYTVIAGMFGFAVYSFVEPVGDS